MALQWMRSNMGFLKWFLWVVIAAFVVLFGNDWSGVGQGNDTRIAAWVGSQEIETAEVQDTYRRIEEQYRQIFGERYSSDMAQQFNLAGQALRATVEREIMLREAQSLGLAATDEELREQILEYPYFQDEDGRFVGAEEYTRRVRAAGFASREDFEDRLREDILRTKLETILRETVYVSDQEIEAVYRKSADRAKLRYVTMPASEFADIEVDQDALRAYYVDHQEEFRLPEQRAADYVLVDLIQLRQEVDLPEAELRAYYTDHPDEFTQEEQVRARHILLQVTPNRDDDATRAALQALRDRIEGGEDFATVARENSEEPDSASRGGSLGYFGRNAWGEDFTELVFNAEVGPLQGPVKTQYGYHLFAVDDRRAGGVRPFEEVEARIKNRLLGERTDTLAKAKADELAATMTGTMTAEAFREAASTAGVEVISTEPFGVADLVPGIGRGDFAQATFSLAVDGVSAPTRVPRGWAIIRVASVRPPRVPPLPEVTDRVRPAATVVAQKKAAEEALAAAKQRVEAGEAFADVAAELGLEVQESEEFGAGGFVPGIGQNPDLVEMALALEAGAVGGPVAADQGAIFFEVAERKTFDPARFEEEKGQTRDTEEAQRLTKLRAALVSQREKDLDVRYNPAALTALGVDAEQIAGS